MQLPSTLERVCGQRLPTTGLVCLLPLLLLNTAPNIRIVVYARLLGTALRREWSWKEKVADYRSGIAADFAAGREKKAMERFGKFEMFFSQGRVVANYEQLASVFNAVTYGLLSGSRVEEAREFLRRIGGYSMRPTVSMYDSLLERYKEIENRDHLVETCDSFLCNATAAGIELDALVSARVLVPLLHAKALTTEEVLKRMTQFMTAGKKAITSAEQYHALITDLIEYHGTPEHLQTAVDTFFHMDKHGVVPTSEIAIALMHAIIRYHPETLTFLYDVVRGQHSRITAQDGATAKTTTGQNQVIVRQIHNIMRRYNKPLELNSVYLRDLIFEYIENPDPQSAGVALKLYQIWTTEFKVQRQELQKTQDLMLEALRRKELWHIAGVVMRDAKRLGASAQMLRLMHRIDIRDSSVP